MDAAAGPSANRAVVSVDARYEHLTIYRRPTNREPQAMSDGGITDVLHAATDLLHTSRAGTFRPGTAARRWVGQDGEPSPSRRLPVR